jgi:hypothetical protein
MLTAGALNDSASDALPSGSGPIVNLRTTRPFFGLIESVIVDPPANFEFDGAVLREHANAVWTWVVRDLVNEFIDPLLIETDDARQTLNALVPEILSRARAAVVEAGNEPEAARRLRSKVGGDAAFARLPFVLNALKCRQLLEKAQAFGRAANGMQDEAGLALALQSMPLQDRAVAALLMMASVGQVSNPSKLMTAAIRVAGSASEAALQGVGLGPLVDALLAHAQNQIHKVAGNGPFADIDLTCRAIERYHRLARAVNGYVELGRNGRWASIVAALTKAMSERVEPRLREVTGNLNMSMRRTPGNDRVDGEQLLIALNGVYVLATVRDAKDSLGVNATFDQTWQQVGQALEMHADRNLEQLRQNPGDSAASQRLTALITMTEQRFNADYAETLRRAKDSAERPR